MNLLVKTLNGERGTGETSPRLGFCRDGELAYSYQKLQWVNLIEFYSH